MTHSQRQLVVIGMTVAGIVFIVAVAVFLLAPALRRAADLSREVLDVQAELQAQYANRRNLLQSLDQVREVRRTADVLESQFLSPGDELAFITAVEAIAERNGIEADIRLSPSRTGRTNGPSANDSFEIRFNGVWDGVQLSLVELERLETLVIVDSFGVSAGELAPDEERTASLTVRGRLAITPDAL